LKALPLSQIRLSYLDLRDNNIKSIAPLKNLTGLTSLYLSGNLIVDYSPVRSYYTNLLSRDFELRY
jgi:Leucine-rich repeat (LRR) protein